MTVAHASDYGALGPLFVAIFSIMFPDEDVTLNEGGTAVFVLPREANEPVVSLGLTSTMERLDPDDLARTRETILQKIESTSTVFKDGFRAVKGENSVSTADRDIALPIIMSRKKFEINETHSGGRSESGESSLVGWRLFDGVVAMVTFDRGSVFHHLLAKDLPLLGLNRDEARILAMRNLKKLYARQKYRFDYNERVHEVGGMNGLASSLLLIDEFWAKQRSRLGGDLVIHLVNRESLVFFAKSDRDLLARVILLLVSGQASNLVDCLFEFDGKMKLFSVEGQPKVH
ncbi:hypothetical protein HFN89_01860 [Rhizobium laguerreae]|nr:hypothetical protein [Rhizobium laguerreae]